MQHSFTDQQIDTAKHLSARRMSRDWISRFNVKDIRAFLDALPESDDEWQPCEFEDIQKGDRVRLVLKNGPLTESPTVIETEPHVAKAHYLAWSRHRTGSTIEASDVQAVYRIPKPVTTPDPVEHPVIIVHKAAKGPFVDALKMVYSGGSYVGSGYDIHPESITEWEPADIVPKAVTSNA